MRRIGFHIVSIVLATGSASAMDPYVVSHAEQSRIWDEAVRSRTAQLLASTHNSMIDADIVKALEAVQDDQALGPVRQDAVFYQYVHALRARGAIDAPDAALDWLVAHQPQAYRHHDESVTARVPLFDVASTAIGLRNEKRHESTRLRWLDASPIQYTVLLQDYLSTRDTAVRRGAESAIRELASTDLETLGTIIGSPNTAMSTTRLGILVRLALDDFDGLTVSLRHASPALVTELLQSDAFLRDVDRAMQLYRIVIEHPDSGVRGVAIAKGSDLALTDERYRSAWLAILAARLIDPEDGSAAAVQIARLPASDFLLVAKQSAVTGSAVGRQNLELIQRLRADLVDMESVSEELP